MVTLKILHVADLHFGYVEEDPLKKAAISDELKRELRQDEPKAVFLRNSQSLFRTQKVDVLAFTGDVGVRDDVNAIKSGVQYLSKLKDRLSIDASSVIAAPGNHDLCREAATGDELTDFIEACSKEGFACAGRHEPACRSVKGIPIVAINTCLGGTEHALYGLPKEFWEAIKTGIEKFGKLEAETLCKMPDDIRDQLRSIDVPAIGQSQFDKIDTFLQPFPGNCAVVLGHHNPLPDHRLIVRPYAGLVDAGRLIFSLMNNGRKALFLHGHTHWDSTLVAKSPDTLDSGFVISLGENGLHTMQRDSAPSVALIQVFADKSGNFLCAAVSRYHQRGISFSRVHSFHVLDDSSNAKKDDIDIDYLSPRTAVYFEDLAEKLNMDQDELAVALLRRTAIRQIEIENVDQPRHQWRITRNG